MLGQHGARHTDFRTGEKLGVRDIWYSGPGLPRSDWMSRETYYGHPKAIMVREVKIGKKELVTTLLLPRKTANADLEALFLQRWHVVLELSNIKTTLSMESLSCKSPEMWRERNVSLPPGVQPDPAADCRGGAAGWGVTLFERASGQGALGYRLAGNV